MPIPYTPPEGALHAPHTLRNREPVLAVLEDAFAACTSILEVGCGTGEQAPFFAARLPHLAWQPSDIDPGAIASARAWAEASNLPNLAAPIALDAAAGDWNLPAGFSPDGILSINMIHIAPWAACEGLMAGAGRLLPPGGVLVLYGPFSIDGAHTAPSNEAFDRTLQARDSAWGIRDLADVTALAERNGLARARVVPMPANNLTVVFRRD